MDKDFIDPYGNIILHTEQCCSVECLLNNVEIVKTCDREDIPPYIMLAALAHLWPINPAEVRGAEQFASNYRVLTITQLIIHKQRQKIQGWQKIWKAPYHQSTRRLMHCYVSNFLLLRLGCDKCDIADVDSLTLWRPDMSVPIGRKGSMIAHPVIMLVYRDAAWVLFLRREPKFVHWWLVVTRLCACTRSRLIYKCSLQQQDNNENRWEQTAAPLMLWG